MFQVHIFKMQQSKQHFRTPVPAFLTVAGEILGFQPAYKTKYFNPAVVENNEEKSC